MQQNQPIKKQYPKVMNATITTGSYVDKATGAKKNSYLTIGTLFVYSNGGMSLKLDALPTNGQNITFYPRKAKAAASNFQQNQANQNFSSKEVVE